MSPHRTKQDLPLVAVDIGNTRLKLGLFRPPLAQPLPEPVSTLTLPHHWPESSLADWHSMGAEHPHEWVIASVHRPSAIRLVEWLGNQSGMHVRLLGHEDLPLQVALERPDYAGIDRLVNAVAANRLRTANTPAIVIDLGSAITVDRVSAEGVFVGGAILPGMGLSARALHAFTDLLPAIEVHGAPPPLGTSTIDAMRSGLFWGAVGAVKELIARLSSEDADCEVFLTGGGSEEVAPLVGIPGRPAPRYVPHLTLAGIALAAAARPHARGTA